MKLPTIELTCGTCSTKFKVHLPVVSMQPNPWVTTLVLSSPVSPSERICPSCKAYYIPIPNLSTLSLQWAEAQPPEELKAVQTLIKPTLVLPPGFNPKGN